MFIRIQLGFAGGWAAVIVDVTVNSDVVNNCVTALFLFRVMEMLPLAQRGEGRGHQDRVIIYANYQVLFSIQNKLIIFDTIITD